MREHEQEEGHEGEDSLLSGEPNVGLYPTTSGL